MTIWNTLMRNYPPGCVNGAGKTLPNLKPDTRTTKLKQDFVPKIKLKASWILGEEEKEIKIILIQILFFVSTRYLKTKLI